MADTLRTDLLALLDDLEQELRRLGYWQGTPPAPEAFLSTTPFSADTMAFTEWLQWVFVARFRALVVGGHPLPGACDVRPMAEQALSGLPRCEHLLCIIGDIDDHF
ncbi:YqcC family protein [Alcanivorax sp. JB21]|uniref:YqcC family protein n=1 Tax=Alcanivorax limicola TaxID=2874102 RepID=UPI001CC14854|nr:YqcC family protein [Alcanivorax limicola]MBZ2189188.1 YqcC family protein [Alcanivorax limicola]